MVTAVLVYLTLTFGWWAIESSRDARAIDTCIADQVDDYSDLCAESSSGYEDMNGSNAHFEGVQCAVDSARACLEVVR